MQDMPAQWQHGRANGAFCWWFGPGLLVAAVALALGKVAEVQTVLCSTILGLCANRQGSSLTTSTCSLARRCACTRWSWIVPSHGMAATHTWLHVM